jgi:hypothetical protein
MRLISTLFACLILLLSTLYAQDSNDLKIPGLKILNRLVPLTTSSCENVIRIRCMATPLNDKPLFVIDGMIADELVLKNINPDSIENIRILKDHAATALIACKAFSGVVLITTKTANQRTIQIKDFITGEALPSAKVEVILNDQKNDTALLETNSDGKFVTNRIIYGKEYELTAACVGYKPYHYIINSKIIGKSFTVLLFKEFKTLSLVENSGPIRQMCYNVKTNQLNELVPSNKIAMDQFKVFPNPTKAGSDITIVWEKAIAGEYIIDLYNLQGQLIKSSLIKIKNDANSFTFQIPIITSGSYVLRLTNKKSGKKHVEKIIIQ